MHELEPIASMLPIPTVFSAHLYVTIFPIPLNDALVRTLLSIHWEAGLQEGSCACHWHAWYDLIIQRPHMSTVIAYMAGLPAVSASPVLHNPSARAVTPAPVGIGVQAY